MENKAQPTDAAKPATLPVRGLLLHITHYDPQWNPNKEREAPFDLDVGLEALDAMAAAGLNLLLLDVKDGVRYRSHPELARHYSRDISILGALRERAAARGLEVAVKLNFSQSALHRHNDWFRPHNDLFDSPEYWRLAFEVIDELIAALRPARFFHIGMDEDHSRSYRQYVAAIRTLHDGLAARGLRTVIWNDSACHWPAAEIHRDKSLEAERAAPKDVVQVLWDYGDWDAAALARIRGAGFDLWGAPGGKPENVTAMRNRLRQVGGSGILLTRWRPCVAAQRQELLDFIAACGPLCG